MQINHSSSQVEEYDVVVLGAGIAGTVLTYLLNQSVLKIKLIGEASQQLVKLGESLPPSALAMLERLNLDSFLRTQQTSSGYQAVWGSDQLNNTGFGSETNNLAQTLGWKLDKLKLIDQIKNTFKPNVYLAAKVESIESNTHGHNIYIKDQSVPLKAKILIDASGRKGFLSRNLGFTSHQFDQLLAYTVNVPKIPHQDISKPVLIEAFEHGWGLVSELDKHHNVLSLFTNKNSSIAVHCKKLAQWQSLCQKTKYFKHFIPVNSEHKVHCLNASSRISAKLHADNWLLIGDAAMSFDPLSSHGITTAIYSAEQAAKAIKQQLTSPGEHFSHYAQNLTAIYNTYLNELVSLYRHENRWPQSGFWLSKQHIQNTEPAIVA